ncbi:Aste57867_6589 [Aphanomyces stellatus]|uniref:Aste57867_6589 protein n=2 Tax=Aphanomyces stellatus TaxID=120398 RepID=A0A485KED6_9STRA|nr:hypothetical protein As57867_006572 [Aphanomyces stellatus]VFT83569.1 Aste57867_6589 [Aphanomyces stellatus]
MKLSAFALFVFVAAAFALKNDATTGDDSQVNLDSGDDYDEDDAAIDAGAEYIASLDEEDQEIIAAWVAEQVNDDGDDAAAAADDSPEVSQGN